MVLVQPEETVIDEQLADPRLLVLEGKSTGPPLVAEVETVGVAGELRPIEEVQALIIERSSRMVVDDIQQDCQPIGVTDGDKRLDLSDLAIQRTCGSWVLPLAASRLLTMSK